jgi:hypothetical protein
METAISVPICMIAMATKFISFTGVTLSDDKMGCGGMTRRKQGVALAMTVCTCFMHRIGTRGWKDSKWRNENGATSGKRHV